MSIGWDVSELLAERDELRRKLEIRDRQLADVDRRLRVAEERAARFESECIDLGTRLQFAQQSAIMSSRTTHTVLARLQAAAEVCDRVLAFLGGRTANEIRELGARKLLDASAAYERTLKGAS